MPDPDQAIQTDPGALLAQQFGQQPDAPPPAAAPAPAAPAAPPTQPAAPPTAIQTTPPAPQQPTFDDDAVYKQSDAADEDALNRNTLSVRHGFQKGLDSPDYNSDQDVINARRAQEYIDQHRAELTAKQYDAMSKQAAAQYKAARTRMDTAHKAQERDELQKVDGAYATTKNLEEFWAEQQQARTAKLDNKGIDDPQKRKVADLITSYSGLKTMDENDFNRAALEVNRLNRNYPLSMATNTLATLTSPAGRNLVTGDPLKAYNGLPGRAGSNYIVKGTDVVGNVVLQTPQGYLRVPRETYVQIKAAKNKAYDAFMKDQQAKAKKQ